MSAPAATGSSQQQQQQQGDAPLESQQQQQQQQGQVGQQSQDAALTRAADSSSSSSSSSTAAGVYDDDDQPMAKPQVVLVGATIRDADVDLALARQWIDEPVAVRVGAAGSVPAGLRHRAIVVPAAERRLTGLVASLRADLAGELEAADAAAAGGGASALPAGADGDRSSSSSSSSSGSSGVVPPRRRPVRVIVFAPSEAEARGAAEPLRAALWGDHMLAVLLPSTGAEPVKALHAFRDRVASLLLATPSAARGLDLPAISHVYSLGLPAGATDYVHRAGRAGRIGSTCGGDVVSVITSDELPKLRALLEGELGLVLDVVEEGSRTGPTLLGRDWDAARAELLDDGDDDGAATADGSSSSSRGTGAGGADGVSSDRDEQRLDAARRGLEDLFNLM
jgi:Helicase conserved C-terminal domain